MLTKKKITSLHLLLENDTLTVTDFVSLLDVLSKEEHVSRSSSLNNLELLTETVANYYGISVEKMISTNPEKEINRIIQIAMYIAYETFKISFEEIGKYYGNRHHSSSMSAYRIISKQLDNDAKLQEDIRGINTKLN